MEPILLGANDAAELAESGISQFIARIGSRQRHDIVSTIKIPEGTKAKKKRLSAYNHTIQPSS